MENERFGIRLGMEVRTSDGATLGRVTQIGAGTFELESGFFARRELSMSYDEVDRLEGGVVVLSLSGDEIERLRSDEGLGLGLAERAAGAVAHARQAIARAMHPAHTPK